MKKSLNSIVSESINAYLRRNIVSEASFFEDKKSDKDEEKDDKYKDKEEDKKNNKKDDKPKKKKKKFKKNAIKGKGGLRKDFDIEDDETYNQNVDDQEQSAVKDVLTNGFINIKKVAEKLYPDHTPEGAQSQLNKKLRGDKSDSGSTYKLKKREVKRLRHIIASYFKN